MMRRTVIKCVIVCLGVWLLSVCVVQAGSDARLTNKKDWQAMNEADQLWYLKGLYDGAFLAEERADYKRDLPRTTLGEMRKLLSAFYDNPEHADIPVPHALMIIRLEQAGAPSGKITAFKKVVKDIWGRHRHGYNGNRRSREQ